MNLELAFLFILILQTLNAVIIIKKSNHSNYYNKQVTKYNDDIANERFNPNYKDEFMKNVSDKRRHGIFDFYLKYFNVNSILLFIEMKNAFGKFVANL